MRSHKRIHSAKVVQVVEVQAVVGKGTEEDPNRVITQYWSLEGELLAERDPLLEDEG